MGPNKLQVTDLASLNVSKIDAFDFNYGTQTKNEDVKKFFTEHFGMDLLAVYTQSEAQFIKDDLNWGCNSMLLFLTNGKIIRMDNSEWASIRIIAPKPGKGRK